MTGVWSDQVLPRLLDVGMRGQKFIALRRSCVPRARGRVLELGVGGGLNFAHYATEVSELLALEPNAVARRIAVRRARHCPFPVRFVGLRGEELPLDDGSVDAVISTFTLCTVDDIDRVLAEVARVLAPRGQFHFLEHGLSPDPRVARWQRALTPLQVRLCGGCHFDRDIEHAVRSSPLELVDCERFDGGRPRFGLHIHRGSARVATAAETARKP